MSEKRQRGGKLFFYAFLYWTVFVVFSVSLGYLKLFVSSSFAPVLTFALWGVIVFLAVRFIASRLNARFRDICFIGFFWVWLSIMFEYWFLTYLLDLNSDTVLRNNMLFSSPVQIITYAFLFFSPIMSFYKRSAK